MTTGPNRAKLTKSYVDRIAPNPTDTLHWDTDIRGFGIRVTPRGKITFMVQGRVVGSDSAIRITIGAYGGDPMIGNRDDWPPKNGLTAHERQMILQRQAEASEERRARSDRNLALAIELGRTLNRSKEG